MYCPTFILLTLLAVASAQASAPSAVMRQDYYALRSRAEKLGGAPGDIAQRVVFLRQIFEDSRRNDPFPIVALHGALWADGFFPSQKTLGKTAFLNHPFNRGKRKEELAALDRFSEAFKSTNRQVFVDTFTNFYFTRAHGTEPGADTLVNPELLAALNQVHAAVASGRRLTRPERRTVFEQSLYWEQETSVAKRVDQAVREFGHPLLAFFALMPAVRFSYFPEGDTFHFRDFSDKQERIQYALRAYEIAEDLETDEAASWEAVVKAMRAYGVLPKAYFADPQGYAGRLFQAISTKDIAYPR